MLPFAQVRSWLFWFFTFSPLRSIRFFFLDDMTGFEINSLIEIPEPYSFILTWFAAVPFIVWLAQSITNAIINDFLILKGPCPNCGTENTSFFGTILSISSGNSTNKVKCVNCGTAMVYDSSTRLITLPEGSNAWVEGHTGMLLSYHCSNVEMWSPSVQKLLNYIRS